MAYLVAATLPVWQPVAVRGGAYEVAWWCLVSQLPGDLVERQRRQAVAVIEAHMAGPCPRCNRGQPYLCVAVRGARIRLTVEPPSWAVVASAVVWRGNPLAGVVDLAACVRSLGHSWDLVTAVVRRRFGLPPVLAARVAHGWSLAQVAERWHERYPLFPKSVRTVRAWEVHPVGSRGGPTPTTVARLAEVFEVSTDSLSGTAGVGG